MITKFELRRSSRRRERLGLRLRLRASGKFRKWRRMISTLAQACCVQMFHERKQSAYVYAYMYVHLYITSGTAEYLMFMFTHVLCMHTHMQFLAPKIWEEHHVHIHVSRMNDVHSHAWQVPDRSGRVHWRFPYFRQLFDVSRRGNDIYIYTHTQIYIYMCVSLRCITER